ncbi:hypothetical protein BDF14DRAFT_1784511 [Spinellus fusiger]|nr:hypothetical protein BDF14DRAFT_1784511 [Spinellus fusiger]
MPKPFNKKQKPLTSLEKLKKKKKEQLIHKAVVKSNYHKTLSKEKADLDVPDYVKEIFSEKTIDDDGNIVDYATQKGTKRPLNPPQQQQHQSKKKKMEEDRVYDLEEDSSSEEEEEETVTQKGKKQKSTVPKHNKPNPFKSQLAEQKKSKEEAIKAKEEKQKEYEAKNKARAHYYKERNQVRGKMLAKNSRGQPNLATQMSVLLDKLQKDTKGPRNTPK